jgi:hypothetical protein
MALCCKIFGAIAVTENLVIETISSKLLSVGATNIGATPVVLAVVKYGFVVMPNRLASRGGARGQLLNTQSKGAAFSIWHPSRSWPLVASEVLPQFERTVLTHHAAGNVGRSQFFVH